MLLASCTSSAPQGPQAAPPDATTELTSDTTSAPPAPLDAAATHAPAPLADASSTLADTSSTLADTSSTLADTSSPSTTPAPAPTVAPPIKPAPRSPYADLSLRYPTRIDVAADGSVAVSDASQGLVIVFTPGGERRLTLGGFSRPLGVAFGPEGDLYIGTRGARAVQVYDASGRWRRVIGAGEIAMPNDLAVDHRGAVYIADSASNAVRIYGPDGAHLRTIDTAGPPGATEPLRFPAAVALSGEATRRDPGELYIADQGEGRVQVYDLSGQWRRSFGDKVEDFSTTAPGRFVRLQSLALDGRGALLALDSAAASVTAFDAATGGVIGDLPMGDAGALGLPLDLALGPAGALLIADARQRRIVTLPLP